ncbi:MAG: FAD-dependent thymidylate synthase [Actinomycetota bacterium]
MSYHHEQFSRAEQAVLSRFFTNVDRPVFALINLPEVVKGALFARYSRSAKSVRRLFLDEFMADPDTGIESIAGNLDGNDSLINLRRAETLYQRVFFEYGDDSVAQLGGVHLACEQASNLLTKVLEWGRLAAYLEQSTRYIEYDVRLGDRFRYHLPVEVARSVLADDYSKLMEGFFKTYSDLVRVMSDYFRARFPKGEGDSATVWNATIRAKACDTVRGLLPASTLSNVGIFASGQAYEMALVRMAAHPLDEVRSYSVMMLEELRKVIPSFLTRVDLPDRGRAWSEYLASTRLGLEKMAQEGEVPAEVREGAISVELTDWDPEAEVKLAASALYAASELSDAELIRRARAMTPAERAEVIATLVGDRSNRRHKPGRAMERTGYRFDVMCDFGAFRDLQRHRLMTIEWQRLSARLGYQMPPELEEAGVGAPFVEMMERAGDMYERSRQLLGQDVAQYVVPFAFQIRFVMEMNARQAFHLIELRTQPAGHPTYRQVCAAMHSQIESVAGHRAIAAAMSFVDRSDVDLERLEAERRAERQRAGR